MIELNAQNNALMSLVSFRSWKTSSEKLHDLSNVMVLCAPDKSSSHFTLNLVWFAWHSDLSLLYPHNLCGEERHQLSAEKIFQNPQIFSIQSSWYNPALFF